MAKRNNVLKYYKMTYDTGFAPNPFHGFLTLATCKPYIRSSCIEGDWILGLTALKVCVDEREQINFSFPTPRLLYLARVEKKIPYAEYWNGAEYQVKKPKLVNARTGGCQDLRNCRGVAPAEGALYNRGDNIYMPNENNDYVRQPNSSHGDGEVNTDLRGKNVLVCNEFYYFGAENALQFDELNLLPKAGRGHRVLGLDDEAAKAVISYVTRNYTVGRHDMKKINS